jgi:alkylation response protein AidB-like acyl-CoA dehydrogenase
MVSNRFSKRIQELLPTIRARRDEIEHGRRLPRDLVDELVGIGVFRLGIPRALGGEELDPVDQLRVIETISTADGSTGWCAMIALGNGLFAGFMPEVGAKEVFAVPALATAASIAPAGTAVPVEGGIRLSGRWRFASGIDHAGWVLAGCVVTESGTATDTPSITHAFMPITEVTIHDTWHASGLCGTGSHDFEADDVFVPEQRVVSVFDRTRHRPEPLYQIPVLALFAPHIAAVAIGIASAALDELTALAIEKTPSFSTVALAEKPLTQVELARAEAALCAARSFLYDSLDDLWQTVSTGREPSKRQHAMCRMAALHASETAARVTRTASVLAGGTSIYTSSSLQRHARDADAALHHVTQSPQMWEECGRALLGFQPLFPIF